jgi:hypothetical protein
MFYGPTRSLCDLLSPKPTDRSRHSATRRRSSSRLAFSSSDAFWAHPYSMRDVPCRVRAWWLWRWWGAWSASCSHRMLDGPLSALSPRWLCRSEYRWPAPFPRSEPPPGAARQWPICHLAPLRCGGGLALGALLLVYVWVGLGLAAGDILVPQRTDEALIHVESAGFATCLVFGVASRVFGRFCFCALDRD